MSEIASRLAPTGTLRVTINTGNPILAQPGPTPDTATGVTVDLAEMLANALQVPLKLDIFPKAVDAVTAVATEFADVGFFAVDPNRGEHIDFTAPYLLIEGTCLVHEAHALHDLDGLDRPEHRVVVGQGSAYDLHLSRVLQHAQVVRVPTSADVVPAFLQGEGDVAAGIREALQAEAHEHPGLRVLPGHFMQIRQAMGVHRLRGPEASAYLIEFLEARKADGTIAKLLQRHGIVGPSVAPPLHAAGN